MKTPEEIKKGLECCRVMMSDCEECPYEKKFACTHQLKYEAHAYIIQLEHRLAQVERERDALMFYVPHNCISCKHEEKRYECTIPCKWEWRGVRRAMAA